jgi:hypothetical protein
VTKDDDDEEDSDDDDGKKQSVFSIVAENFCTQNKLCVKAELRPETLNFNLYNPSDPAVLDYDLYCSKQREERTFRQRMERTRPTAVVAPQVPINIPTKPAIQNQERYAAVTAGISKYWERVSRTSFPLSSPEYLAGAGRNEPVVLGDLATAQGVVVLLGTFSLKVQCNSHSQGHQVPAGKLAFPGSVTPDVLQHAVDPLIKKRIRNSLG